jgi:hypothetical protein
MTGLGNALFRTAVALVLTGGAVTACGGEQSAAPPPSPTPPATAHMTTPRATSPTTTMRPTAPSWTTTTPASPGGSRSIAQGIPIYQPSKVVSQAPGSIMLTSPDPVDRVSDFYVDAVDHGGWQSVSENITSDSTHITVQKPGQGASISIARTGSGTVISISGHPST